MSSFYRRKADPTHPKGRYELKWNIYIDGKPKTPPMKITRLKKHLIPNKVISEVKQIEEATRLGIASDTDIERWLTGYPEISIPPLIRVEDALRAFPGYRDSAFRTDKFDVDFSKAIDRYSDLALAEQQKDKTAKRKDDTDDSHHETMNELNRVLNWLVVQHPTVRTFTRDNYFDWWIGLQREYANSTVNKRNFAMRKFLQICVDLGMLKESPYPADLCKQLPQSDTKPRRILNIEEVENTLEILSEKAELYYSPEGRRFPLHGCLPISILLGLHTGVRTNECRWAEWNKLRYNSKRPSDNYITIQSTTCEKTKRYHSAKTHEWRRIGINSRLREALISEKKRQEELGILGQFIIPSGRFNRPSSRGTVVSDNQFADSLNEFNTTESDIYTTPEMPTYYSYRHTYCTNLLRSGVDLETVRARMGHSSILTTQKYLRYIDAREETVEEKLPY
jgi:site-specific recombinase XerD